MTFEGADLFNLGWVGARLETSFGSRAAGNTTRWIGVVKNSVPRRVPTLERLGGIRDSRYTSGNGQLELNAHYEYEVGGNIQNPWIFYAALGLINSAGSAPTTHTITAHRGATGLSALYLPSFTMENLYEKTSNTQVSMLGSTADSLACTFPTDGISTFTLAMIAKSRGSAVTAPTESELDPMGGYNTEILIDADAATYSSGESVVGTESVDLTFGNNLDITPAMNAKTILQPFPGLITIASSILRKYLDSDLVALADGTPFSMRIDQERDASNDYIQILLENIIPAESEETLNLDNPVQKNSLNFIPGKITITAKDGNTSYE